MARKVLLGLGLMAALTCTVQGQAPQWKTAPGLQLPGQSGRAAVGTASPAAMPVGTPIASSGGVTLPGQSWQASPPPVVYMQPGRLPEPQPLNLPAPPRTVLVQAQAQPQSQAQPIQHILPPTPGSGTGAIPRPMPQMAAQPQTQPSPTVPPDLMPVPQPSRVPQPPILPVQAPVQPREKESEVSVDIPGRERIFGHFDTERAWQERIRQEARDKLGTDKVITFPDEAVLSREPYAGRNWPRQYTYVEPNFLVYRRLYFEEANSERYGWDLGPISPFVSTMYFYRDTLLLPYRFGSDIGRHFETNAGHCLPGDPVPYLIYPIGVSYTGTATSTATLLILLAAFP